MDLELKKKSKVKKIKLTGRATYKILILFKKTFQPEIYIFYDQNF